MKGEKQGISTARAVGLLLLLFTLLLYSQSRQFSFVNFDDPLYVTDNPMVQKGLTPQSLRWAFTGATRVTNYWAPLTWLTFLVDFEIYGSDPGGYHVTNILLHAANTLLLFLLLHTMTGALWRSALVAALFSVHPLHVESVAWVTERKDVLSTLFWLLTMIAYVRYARRPSPGRYAPVALFYLFGIMAKPMLVTLPFVLLLCDVWPLDRIGPGRRKALHLLRLIGEKLPLLAIAAAASVAAYITQEMGGAVKDLGHIPVGVRFANVWITYIAYLVKTVWPTRLAILYPYPVDPSMAAAAACAVSILVASVATIRFTGRCPYLAVGWFWYLGTLFPVIGLVVIGPYVMADRYTYVPLIGIFILIVWGGADLCSRLPGGNAAGALAGVLSLALLSTITVIQTGRWQNSITLFEHAVSVTSGNYLAHNNLGKAYLDRGELETAAGHFRIALDIAPGYLLARNNLAVALAMEGRPADAMAHLEKAVAADPEDTRSLYNMAQVLIDLGRYKDAAPYLRRVLARDADHVSARRSLAAVLARAGQIEAAADHLKEALRREPENSALYLEWVEIEGLRRKAQQARSFPGSMEEGFED